MKLFLDKILKVEILFFIVAFYFIFFVMQSTFSKVGDDFSISYAVCGDFSTHISLIRSFSLGNNFPPEYPLYAGEGMRYHYLFYLLAGGLERVGLPIDFALNFLSALAYTVMLIFAYKISYALFKSKLAAIISNLLIIFTPALSWLYVFFIGKEKISSLSELFTKTTLYNVGPYDNQVLSLYWDLETFTNQRHLAFGIALGLAIIWYLRFSKSKWRNYLVMLLLFVLSWAHKSIWLLAIGFIITNVIISKKRKVAIKILIGCIMLSIPALLFLNDTKAVTSSLNWQLGFVSLNTDWNEFPIITHPLLRWIWYWVINWSIAFIALVYFSYQMLMRKITSVNQRYLIFSTVSAFIICNLFNFTQDVNANHKFFNFLLVIAVIFGGRIILLLMRKKWLYIGWAVLMVSIIGGILSLVPIVNFPQYTTADIPKNITARWINKNTPPDARFLVLTDDVEPIYIAGRRIIGLFPHAAWSFGYDFAARRGSIENIIQGKDKIGACKYIVENGIRYIYLSKNIEKYLDKLINYKFIEEISNEVFTTNSEQIMQVRCDY